MKLPQLANLDSPGLILLFIVLFFGAIALVTFLIRKFVPGLKEKGGHINEEVAIQEELDRILEPITDEEVLEKIEKTEANEPSEDEE